MEGATTPNPEKDPREWVTGDEPMTGPQASYLRTLCQEAGEPFDESVSKADASRRIDELQARTGRGGRPGPPAGGSAAPAEGSAPSGEGSTPSAEGSAPPDQGSTPPDERSSPPAEGPASAA